MFLRLISRQRFNKHCIFKNPTQVYPEDVRLLQARFRSDRRFSQKLAYLQQRESENTLSSFYQGKELHHFNDQQIFYLLNSPLSHDYDLNMQNEIHLLLKVHSVYFKCLLNKQFRLYSKRQKHITQRFNQQVFELTPQEIVFCLKVLHQFQNLQENLDIYRLEKALLKFVDNPQYSNQMISINGYLNQVNVTLQKVLNKDSLRKWLQHNQIWDLRSIFYIYNLSQKLQEPIDPIMKSKLDQQMDTALISFKSRQFELDYMVFLLKYYPEQANKINITQFTPKAYMGYLTFFKKHPQLATVQEHKIPPSSLQKTALHILVSIMILRFQLKLDTSVDLAKNMSQFFTDSLRSVKAFIIFLRQMHIDNPQTEYIVEKTIISKLHFQQFEPQQLEAYPFNDIVDLLAKICESHFCSVDFWRKAVKWVEGALSYHQKEPLIEPQSQVYLNLLKLVVSKNFKQKNRDKIYKQISSMLQNLDVFWSLRRLQNLTRTLASAKVGQHRLWLLIESRVLEYMKLNRSLARLDWFEENLFHIAVRFSIMNRGSYNFWNTLNVSLSNKSKQQILEKYKNLNSQAHTYLKISSDTNS